MLDDSRGKLLLYCQSIRANQRRPGFLPPPRFIGFFVAIVFLLDYIPAGITLTSNAGATGLT
jgi:hypothetical protein